MKSRVSTPERLSITKSKVNTARSNSAVQISNKSATNLFISKNLSTLQIYNNLFGNKNPHPVGDANTHFKKSLRKYNEFTTLKHTKWINRGQNKPKLIKAEYKKASGDQPKSLENSKEKLVEPVVEKESIEMAEAEAEGEEVAAAEEDEAVPALDDIQDMVKEVEAEMDMGEGGEDYKAMLHKSMAEMEKAVTQLDKDALDTMAVEVEQKIDDLGGKETKGEGDTTLAVYPAVDNKVLKELEEAEAQARSTADIINELKDRVAALLTKDHMTQKEGLELEEMNKQLMQHMANFEEKTRLIQMLVSVADQHLKPMPSIHPAIQGKHKEDMLPKVVICGMTENNMPRILICDAKGHDARKRRQSGEGGESDRRKSSERRLSLPSPAGVVPQIAKRLSESYDMQEKLAADNVDLEGKRYRLQEELCVKDRCVEGLQRKLCSLQAEMRIVVKENQTLNDRLEKLQGKCRSHPNMPCGSGRGLCPADVENRIQHYSQTTSVLEKQVESMEDEVRRMQEELCNVKRERAEMEHQRQLSLQQAVPPPPPPAPLCRPGCGGPCRGVPPTPAGPNMAEQQLRELREQYNRLQDDYKAKLTEVAGLRADNEMMRRTAGEAERLKKECEHKLEEYEREVKTQRSEKNKLMGSKEMLIEQEQQLAVAKQRFREAQDELDELRACIQDQATQLDDYRNKYLVAQQQVEEQRRQIDVMEMENQRISEQVTCEIQRVKNQFQEKLAELSPLPDILKATQLKLQEEQHLRGIADRNLDAVQRELQMYKDKLACMASQMEKHRSDQQLGEDERVGLMSRIAGWECRCNEMQQQCDKLKTEMARAEEQQLQNEKRLEEKLHEVAQLTAQLESVREESARQVTRTKERCETVRRSLQGQIAEMERQLAQSRAAAKAAQKDRDDIRHKMQAQISNLNENFEEAQLRIRSLQGHVNFLKTSYTSMFGGADPMSCGGGQGGGQGPGPQDDDSPCGCGSYS